MTSSKNKGWLSGSGKSDDEQQPADREEQQITEAQRRAAEEAGRNAARTAEALVPPGQVMTTPVATEANPQISDDPTDPNAPQRKAWTGTRTVDMDKLWKWKQRVLLGGPRQADWEEFDEILRPRDEGTTGRADRKV
jgi:hypothetical protein